MSSELEDLASSVLAYDAEAARNAAERVLAAGIDPLAAIEKGLAKGVKELGKRFEKGEIFLPHLVAGAEAMKAAMSILEPRIAEGKKRKSSGKLVIGTVHGDIHDIGKNLVSSMLRASGLEVHDLGRDVPNETFVEKVRQLKPQLLGLSALMMTTVPAQKEVIDAVKRNRLKVQVMVGGAPVNAEWARKIGAEGYADNAMDAVKLADRLMKKH
jgi:corrinoid protein of di/trimethylamine methyltransferase